MNNKPQYPKLDFNTPVSRLLQGNLATPSDRGYQGAVRDTPQYYFAIGIPKTDPGAIPLLTNIQNHTFQSYGGLGQAGAGVIERMRQFPIGSTVQTGFRGPFAWKIEDGDHPDNIGKEGWAGCWVMKFTTTFPFGVCDANNQQLDPAAVKNGWWVEVAGNVVINGQTNDTASIHINPRFVRVVGYDKEIVSGPTADQVFGAPPVALPPGVSATPVAPAHPMPGAGGVPAPVNHQQTSYPAPQTGSYAGSANTVAPGGTYNQAPVGNYTQPPAPAPQPMPAPHAVAQQAPQNTGQFQQPSGSYPPQAGQPGTPMPTAGGATIAYPSNPPVGNHAPVAAAPVMPPNMQGVQPPAPMPNSLPVQNAHTGQPSAGGTGYPTNQPPAGVQPHPGFGGQQ